MTNNKIVRKLTKEVNDLQFQLAHYKLYNTRNAVMKFLLKSGITLDKLCPYLLSGVLVANLGSFKKNPPFEKNMVSKPAYIQTIDISNGVHKEDTLFNRLSSTFEYSTSWTINDLGLYERTITSYVISKDIDLNDTDRIFSMSKEDIDELLKIKDVKTITKRELTDNDVIYNDEGVLTITQYVESKDEEVVRMETGIDNLCHSLLYLVFVGIGVDVLSTIKKILIKNVIEDKLNAKINTYRYITPYDLLEIKKVLEAKQENLRLLQENERLRRVRKR